MEQGTAEWLAARLGVPTASKFSAIMTPKTRLPSTQAEKYLRTLVAERLLGHPVDEVSSEWMDRGKALEPEAAAVYELMYPDRKVEKVGFILSDDGRYGASPDRLVNDDGLLEIKCPSANVHIGLLQGTSGHDHMIQCQGQLWIAERQWVDLFHYHPGLPPHETRIQRDELYIHELAKAVTDFCDRLEEAQRKIAKAHPIPPPRYKTPLVA